ncbi:hypothetical protein B0A55_09068 [Friedmanniomyces simplex]|uniref:NTF2-like domain-containing protein n=1 Tax=Friedmanniomyces simplex TaxID=329884 RepID=A0A4U0WUL2_9PEZI|nr:hypothetical protein B0A55_09068 [Friedmanniomyces simplex]
MHFSTIVAASALAATALAAPNAQGRPWGYQPPRRPTTTMTTSTTQATVSSRDYGEPTTATNIYPNYTNNDLQSSTQPSTGSSTSGGVVVDPVGSSTCSAATVTSTSIGIGTLTVTEVGQVSTVTDFATSTITDVATVTKTADGESITLTITEVTAGANATLTITDVAAVTNIAACPTSNNTAPFPTSTSTPEVPDVPSTCVNDEDAEQLAEVFRMLIQNYTSTLALNALTEDFVDYSSAVNIVMNRGAQYPKNITGPTFATRAAFMAGQGSQPKIPFERLQTFHGCDSVSVRWMTTRSGNGQKTEAAMIPVIGNGLMYVVPAEANNAAGHRFRVKDLYSEFNAAAWLVNNGVYRPAGPVDYINQNTTANSTTTTTTIKRSLESFENYDESLRGAMI